MPNSTYRPEWPLRLLYVPTMTSLERQEGNIYDSFKEPHYSILSYTWGRWEVPDGTAALEVNNVPWTIPAIDENHFSATQLQKAIWNISLGRQLEDGEYKSNAFVWIDIACIDQEDEKVKALEIGRQAAIFKNAESAYIWLSHLDASELRACDEILYDSSETLYTPIGEEELDAIDIGAWTESLLRLLEVLLQDPWFTSLWTLQEMYLRADAKILSKSTELIRRKAANGNALALANLVINCTSVYNELTRRALGGQQHAHSSTHIKILNLIERLGLYHGPWENAVLLYGAARHRTTRDPKDRVYGIMQVYKFRLGSSAQPDQAFTLANLELQLAMAHNIRSAISAQLFVHTRIIEIGECWRMDSQSKLPQVLLTIADTDRRSLCEISFGSSQVPRMRAKACQLRDIANVWKQVSSPQESNTIQNVMLDVTTFREKKIPPEMHDLSQDDDRQHDLSSLLVDALNDEVRVFLLGTLVDGVDEDIDIAVGLIATPQSLGTTLCWQRIGICLWESVPEIPLGRSGEFWNEFDGYLG